MVEIDGAFVSGMILKIDDSGDYVKFRKYSKVEKDMKGYHNFLKRQDLDFGVIVLVSRLFVL